LDGKPLTPSKKNLKTPVQRGIPDFNFKVGTINFIRRLPPAPVKKDSKRTFTAFEGEGSTLKRKEQKK